MLAGLLVKPAFAASVDEIQVYGDAINKPGETGLEMHVNYVADGVKTPAWPGDDPAHHSFRVTPEFSWGLTQTFELGLYLPVLRVAGGTTYLEGAKLRLKYISLHDEKQGFYWGMNEELGRVSFRSAQAHWNLEVRPILGYRLAAWHFVLNPIFDVPLSGPTGRTADFAPALAVTFALNAEWNVGLEHFADIGSLDGPLPYAQQGRNTYAVVNGERGPYSLNFGIGRGWNAASDKWTIKAIIGMPL